MRRWQALLGVSMMVVGFTMSAIEVYHEVNHPQAAMRGAIGGFEAFDGLSEDEGPRRLDEFPGTPPGNNHSEPGWCMRSKDQGSMTDLFSFAKNAQQPFTAGDAWFHSLPMIFKVIVVLPYVLWKAVTLLIAVVSWALNVTFVVCVWPFVAPVFIFFKIGGVQRKIAFCINDTPIHAPLVWGEIGLDGLLFFVMAILPGNIFGVLYFIWKLVMAGGHEGWFWWCWVMRPALKWLGMIPILWPGAWDRGGAFGMPRLTPDVLMFCAVYEYLFMLLNIMFGPTWHEFYLYTASTAQAIVLATFPMTSFAHWLTGDHGGVGGSGRYQGVGLDGGLNLADTNAQRIRQQEQAYKHVGKKPLVGGK